MRVGIRRSCFRVRRLRLAARTAQFLERYEVQQVGDRECLEYWIPADELEDFNAVSSG